MEPKALLIQISTILDAGCKGMEDRNFDKADDAIRVAHWMLTSDGIKAIAVDDWDLDLGGVYFEDGDFMLIKNLSVCDVLRTIRAALDTAVEAQAKEYGLQAGSFLRKAQQVAMLAVSK